MAKIVGLTDKVIAERKKTEIEKKKATQGTKTEVKTKG